MLPESVARYRTQYRADEIPRHYVGGINLLLTFAGGSIALLACAWQLESVRAQEWLTIPLAFLYANLVEYFGHRFPMHRPYPGLGLIYRRHAAQHHRFFTAQAMPLESSRDLRAVLFPPLLVVFSSAVLRCRPGCCWRGWFRPMWHGCWWPPASPTFSTTSFCTWPTTSRRGTG